MRIRITPSWATQWGAIKAQLPLQIAVIVLASLSISISTRNPLSAIVIVVLAFGLGALCTWMYFRNVAIEVHDSGVVVKQSWIGTTKTFSVTEIGNSLYALQVGVSWVPAVPLLLFMRPDGTALLRLRGQYWDRASLESLIGALGITPIFVPQRVTPLDLKTVHPRAIGWYEAHPLAFGAIVGGAIVIAVILGTILVFTVLLAQTQNSVY